MRAGGGTKGLHARFRCLNAALMLLDLQAKTTKKIVLRMQCADCKQTCMKPIKVRRAATLLA